MLYDKVIPLQVAGSVELSTSIEYSHYSSNRPSTSIFEWSAAENPSEMDYSGIICCMLNPFFFPSGTFMLWEFYKKAKSQKLKITDDYLDFEHDTFCCCLPCPPTVHHISLDKILFISTSDKKSNSLKLSYYKNNNLAGIVTNMSVIGFVKSSNTPQTIRDVIIQRRPRKFQRTPYTIPHITTSYKTSTITLNPATATVDYTNSYHKINTVAFIDGLGSIDKRVLEYW